MQTADSCLKDDTMEINRVGSQASTKGNKTADSFKKRGLAARRDVMVGSSKRGRPSAVRCLNVTSSSL